MRRIGVILNKIGGILIIIIACFTITVLIAPSIRSQVQQLAGLAVAESGITWNNVKDAAVGDNIVDGIVVVSPYLYDGVNLDRWRGDTTNGAYVNVKSTVAPALSSTITTNQVTVDTTAGGTLIKAANSSRQSIIVRNHGDTDMYIGPTGLTSSTGLLVKAGEAVTLDRTTAAVYGITAADSTTAGYLEE